jgi:uncharacterized protein YdhG (YjbR/CyaY superfamily)
MASSPASTVEQYLAELPAERSAVIAVVRDVVLEHLPEGYEETMNWGMITYEIPLARYPTTYNKQPLSYAALAAQKNYYALYLPGADLDPEGTERLREGFARAGKKLDMGKSCVRFKTLDDLPLDVIGAAVAEVTPEDYIARYEAARQT